MSIELLYKRVVQFNTLNCIVYTVYHSLSLLYLCYTCVYVIFILRTYEYVSVYCNRI